MLQFYVKLPTVKLPPLAITSTVTTAGAAPASEPTAPTVTVALPTPVAPEGPTEEPATSASETTAAPVPITEETDEQAEEEKNEGRRLSVFSASARRKRAAGHLRQVEKRHAHDPHPGVTGQLEYDHPVSYKPQMILNSEVMEQMYETNPEEAAKYVFVSKMPGEASWKTDAQRAAEAAASSSQHLRK